MRLRDEYRDQLHASLWQAELEQMRTAMSSLTAQATDMEKKRQELAVRRQDIGRAIVRFNQIEAELKDLSEQLARYQIGYDNLQIANTGNLDARVRVIASAQIPKERSFPRLKVMLPAGAFLMTLLVGGVIFLREVLDQRVRGPADAAMVPRVKVLGIVPMASEDPARPANIETVFRDSPGGVITESFRQIRAPLVQKMDQGGHKTLLVLGGMPGSGATSVASNLALACAAAGERVLLIDANLRRPSVHKAYKLADLRGLADVLAGAAPLGDCVQESGVSGLHLLGAGTSALRQPERLGGDAMARLLLEAGARFDRVFLDTAPAMVAGDGIALASRCDAVMVVVRAYAEKRGLLARIRGQLADTRADFIGVVVNAVRSSAGGYLKRNIKATHQYQNGKA
jgi:capsular exopolysaccharide synthesis family protein